MPKALLLVRRAAIDLMRSASALCPAHLQF